MIILALSLAALTGAIMKMLTAELEPVLVAWLRFVGYFSILLPIAIWRTGWKAFAPPRPQIQVLRGVMLAIGNVAFIFGVQNLDFENAIAILYIYPFLMIILAPIFLGEKVVTSAWLGVVGGFTGVLLVMRPDPFDLDTNAMLIVLSGVMVSIQMIINRKLGVSVDPIVMSMWGGMAAMICLIPFLPAVWVSPLDWPLGTLALLAIISALAQTLMIMALARATAGSLAPFTYFEIVSGICLGLIMFGTWPDPLAWAGMMLIIISGIIVAKAQGQLVLRRREKV
ncbi:MAG: DMT family transporter [Candidatus Puniceispirillales bacterium]|nr:DMT family transporter [Pseudomonadota bacterium]